MKFIIFYPTDASTPISPAVLDDSENLSEFTTQRIPTVISNDLRYDIHRAKSGPQVLLTVSYPKSTRKEVRFRFRAHMLGEKTSQSWGLNTDLAIPRDPNLDIEISLIKSTGAPSRIPQIMREQHLNTLYQALNAIFVDGPEATLVESDVRTTQRAREIHNLLKEQADRAISEDINRVAGRKKAVNNRAGILSNLPDGTPLAIRSGFYARQWQLGVKRGTVSKALATNAHVVDPEVLRSDEMIKAGLSRHKSLIMGAMAADILAKNPDLSRFDDRKNNWRSSLRLDEENPFHESFYDPREIKERRRNMDVVWIQTGTPFRDSDFYINDRTDYNSINKLKTLNPNFPDTGEAVPIFSLTKAPSAQPSGELRDFEIICGIMTISSRAAEVLRAHNMGRNVLKPLMMVDEEGRHMEGRYLPVIKEGHASIIMSQLPHDLKRTFGMRGVKDFEIPISSDAHGEIDLWTDYNLRSPTLFMSGDLVRALKKEGLSLPSALKRADVY